MPIYQYKAEKEGCAYCRDGFEILQNLKDPPLPVCPECKGPVKKCPSVIGKGGVPTLSDGNLRDKGFTKLKRRGDGTYEKTT